MSLESSQDDKSNGGKDKVRAPRGHVVMHFPYGFAQADDASMDFRDDANVANHKTITLMGDVRLYTGENVFQGGHRGKTLVFDARTGLLDLDGKSFPSGMPKYAPCTKNCKPL